MKHKGFTLIELLAVIVILAIIAVIAIPKILNVVEEAKKGSALSSAYGYIDAVEKQIVSLEMKENIIVPDGDYQNLSNFNTEYHINYKGERIENGNIVLEKRQVKEANFIIKGYSITCDKTKCAIAGSVNGLSSITVTTNPTKTNYKVDDTLDLTGLVVTATYQNGSSKAVNVTSSPSNGATLTEDGTIPVNISYTEGGVTKTTSFNINVEEKYAANRVAITLNYDTSKGGTITENNGEYTLQGQALMRSSSVLNLTTATLYAEVKNTSRYYTSSSTDNSFAGLIIGTGNSGSYTQNNCFGLSDGWGGNVINGFTGSGGYPQINKSELTDGWNRISITYDGSTFKMYLNGVLKASYASGVFKHTKLYIGGWDDAPYSGSGNTWGYVNGIYRNIKVYDIALPASEL